MAILSVSTATGCLVRTCALPGQNLVCPNISLCCPRQRDRQSAATSGDDSGWPTPIFCAGFSARPPFAVHCGKVLFGSPKMLKSIRQAFVYKSSCVKGEDTEVLEDRNISD